MGCTSSKPKHSEGNKSRASTNISKRADRDFYASARNDMMLEGRKRRAGRSGRAADDSVEWNYDDARGGVRGDL